MISTRLVLSGALVAGLICLTPVDMEGSHIETVFGRYSYVSTDLRIEFKLGETGISKVRINSEEELKGFGYTSHGQFMNSFFLEINNAEEELPRIEIKLLVVVNGMKVELVTGYFAVYSYDGNPPEQQYVVERLKPITMTFTPFSRPKLGGTADEQLVQLLASRDEDVSFQAAWEIFEREETMIPLLFTLEGDERPFAGSGYLARQIDGQWVVSSEDSLPEMKVTVEIVALCLINAIFRDKFLFSHSSYLTDLKLPADQRRPGNTKELVRRAWRSAKAWHELLKKEGLDSLRTRKLGPLSAGEVAFW